MAGAGASGSSVNVIKYYYTNGQRIALRDNGGLKFIHADHLGSTSRMSCGDATCGTIGAQARALWYDPWGSVAADGSRAAVRYQYTGQEHDSTGLYDYHARAYDPALGRFLSADTIVPSPGNPQSLNRYAYTLNNPVKYNDPSGHMPPPPPTWEVNTSGWHPWAVGALKALAFIGGAKTIVDGDTLTIKTSYNGGSIPFGPDIVVAAPLTTLTTVTKNITENVGQEVVGQTAGEILSTEGDEVARAAQSVLLDSNVIPKLKADPTLGGRILSGEMPMVSYVTGPELRNAVATGGNLRGVPKALDSLGVLRDLPSLDLRISLRGLLPVARGRFGDGIIGAQAIESGLPLVTDDVALREVVRLLGGRVR